MWGHQRDNAIYPGGPDPDLLVFPPAIRQISSFAYPLIGPYDSDHPEVLRWHVRLAKSAGIDGFLVDWWGEGSGVQTRTVEHLFPIAESLGFKLCIFDESPQFHSDLSQAAEWASNLLSRFGDSPAYLRWQNHPVYCVYQQPAGRLTPEEANRYIQEVEAETGPLFWLFDRIIADGTAGFRVAEGWMEIADIDAYSLYATFAVTRESRPEVLTDWYRKLVKEVHLGGKQVMLPIHPGLDNRKIQTDPVAAGKGEPHWTIPRKGDETLRGYLTAAKASGTDFISVTSFNEWPETTVVEPALTWPDPYRYLKVLAQVQGLEWQCPPLPALKSLDPAVLDYLKTIHRSLEDP
jgi:hypothetical protein